MASSAGGGRTFVPWAANPMPNPPPATGAPAAPVQRLRTASAPFRELFGSGGPPADHGAQPGRWFACTPSVEQTAPRAGTESRCGPSIHRPAPVRSERPSPNVGLLSFTTQPPAWLQRPTPTRRNSGMALVRPPRAPPRRPSATPPLAVSAAIHVSPLTRRPLQSPPPGASPPLASPPDNQRPDESAMSRALPPRIHTHEPRIHAAADHQRSALSHAQVVRPLTVSWQICCRASADRIRSIARFPCMCNGLCMERLSVRPNALTRNPLLVACWFASSRRWCVTCVVAARAERHAGLKLSTEPENERKALWLSRKVRGRSD